jgi:hypothetical protein
MVSAYLAPSGLRPCSLLIAALMPHLILRLFVLFPFSFSSYYHRSSHQPGACDGIRSSSVSFGPLALSDLKSSSAGIWHHASGWHGRSVHALTALSLI